MYPRTYTHPFHVMFVHVHTVHIHAYTLTTNKFIINILFIIIITNTRFTLTTRVYSYIPGVSKIVASSVFFFICSLSLSLSLSLSHTHTHTHTHTWGEEGSRLAGLSGATCAILKFKKQKFKKQKLVPCYSLLQKVLVLGFVLV
jgi:hypothetical protein